MKFLECAVRDVIYGTNVRIVKPVNIYECELRDNVFVGPFVEIQKGCVIGSGSRIQSHTFICENVTLGENCFIGHNVTFANDLFRSGAPDPSPDNWISIILGGFGYCWQWSHYSVSVYMQRSCYWCGGSCSKTD